MSALANLAYEAAEARRESDPEVAALLTRLADRISVESTPRPVLTKRQREILTAVEESIRRRGFAPTLGELCAEIDCHSSATVHEHLTNLEAKGYIRRDFNKHRSITLIPDPA
jgi:DNA-binding MarR family transcriptional regulator